MVCASLETWFAKILAASVADKKKSRTSWKMQHLSYGKTFTLIKRTLFSLPLYLFPFVMSAYFSCYFCEATKDFLWQDLVKWSMDCLVTERDNLFPCFLLVLNKALLANKWVWRFLWIKIDYGGRSWWGSLVRNKKLGVLRWQKGG